MGHSMDHFVVKKPKKMTIGSFYLLNEPFIVHIGCHSRISLYAVQKTEYDDL